VVLEHAISSSKVGFESQEFVACFSLDETKLTKLGALLVPDFQGPLILSEWMFSTARGLDGELIVHLFSPFIGAGALCSPKR